jgi:ATP-dependent DNA ligase
VRQSRHGCECESSAFLVVGLEEFGNKAPALCLWCFDLLSIDGARILPLPLSQRKAKLADVLASADDEHLQFSGDFDDPFKLLDTCHKMGLEGIVSKRRGEFS